MKNIPGPLLTAELKLIILAPGHAKKVLEYYLRNRKGFREWEPARNDSFFRIDYHRAVLRQEWKNALSGSAYRFWIFSRNGGRPEKVLGSLSFSSIIRGPFLSCLAGYSLDTAYHNRGYMTQALERGVRFMFEEKGLHRIEANIMPRNGASLKVVEKLGFVNEGVSPKYLKINGRWEDHIHMVLRNRALE